MREQADGNRDAGAKELLIAAKSRIDGEEKRIAKQRRELSKLPPERRAKMARALDVQADLLAMRKRSLGDVVRAVTVE